MFQESFDNYFHLFSSFFPCLCRTTIYKVCVWHLRRDYHTHRQYTRIALARRCRTILCARWFDRKWLSTFCAIWNCESLLTIFNLNIIIVTNWDGKLLSFMISEVTSIWKAIESNIPVWQQHVYSLEWRMKMLDKRLSLTHFVFFLFRLKLVFDLWFVNIWLKNHQRPMCVRKIWWNNRIVCYIWFDCLDNYGRDLRKLFICHRYSVVFILSLSVSWMV